MYLDVLLKLQELVLELIWTKNIQWTVGLFDEVIELVLYTVSEAP
jgi:hypothetical protein